MPDRTANSRIFEALMFICATAALELCYAWAILALLGLSAKEFDVAFFLIAIGPIPLVAAAIHLIDPTRASVMVRMNFAVSLALMLSLALVPVFMHLSGGGEHFFRVAASLSIGTLLVGHVAALAAALTLHSWREPILRGLRRVEGLAGPQHQSILFVSLLTAATLSSFRIEPRNPRFNLIFEFLAVRNFDPTIGFFKLLLALLFSGIILLAARRLLRAGERARRYNLLALVGACALTVVFYFDYSLRSDAFHYLTNIGPAIHLMDGGTLLVDTFSQYGLGPVIATFLAFKVGFPSVPVANIAVQLFNLSFYCVFLILLHRMTQYKLSATLLGFFLISAFLATWAGGEGVVSAAPSTLGFRYLPSLLVVLSISTLPTSRHHSAVTLLALTVSVIWSAEAAIASIGLTLGFLFFVNLHKRSVVRLCTDVLVVVATAFLGIALISIYTYIQARELPNFAPYFRFLGIYNIVSGRWSNQTFPYFFGWIPFFLVFLVVMAETWIRVIRPSQAILPVDDDSWFYRYVPMALLAAFTSTYYVGRGVDFTLMEAFMPCCVLALPALLEFAQMSEKQPAPIRLVGLVPAFAFVWVLSFSLLALFRVTSPYSMLVNECMRGRCSPGAIAAQLATNIDNNSRFTTITDPWIRYWSDPPVVQQAYRLMHLTPNQPRVETLLGTLQNRDYAGDLVNLYAGKWYRWPRSMTFSDGINPALTDRILRTSIRLDQDEILLVRRDITQLGPLESKLLVKIKSEVELCPVDETASNVVAYRASYTGCR